MRLGNFIYVHFILKTNMLYLGFALWTPSPSGHGRIRLLPCDCPRIGKTKFGKNFCGGPGGIILTSVGFLS
ncbi:MAG: hypothetical protein HW380_3344 [Magnetococcales bacterium]|nr:hypothetical protein [Magnetococcales bacterium]